jgi:SAM-dependent methyltransferase
MSAEPRPDSWATGSAYDPYMGRWSRRVAREFLRWLALPDGGRWLELGCGTGALTGTILEMAAPALQIAADRSTAYVGYARLQNGENPVRFVVADATQLPARTCAADAVVSGLLLNFLPVPSVGVAEMLRAARVGGTVAAYVWDYAGRMDLLRLFWDTAVELDPAAAPLDEGRRFSLCESGVLRRLWQEAGLVDVQSTGLEVTTPYRDFEDYWGPFLGGQGPAPGYVASLGREQVEALRERLRAHLPTRPDGQITLVARAWAVRGRRAA